MVKLKSVFMDWFFYLVILIIKLCKIRYLNINKFLLFWETRLFVRKIEIFGELELPQSLIFFCWKFAEASYLTMSTKGCSGFFYFAYILSYQYKCRKKYVGTRSFLISAKNYLNKIKKIPKTLLQTLVSRKCVRSLCEVFYTTDLVSWKL